MENMNIDEPIQNVNNEIAQTPEQGKAAPEDAAGDAVTSGYESTIKTQQETITNLLGQVESLNKQIQSYIRGVGGKPAEPEPEPTITKNENFVSLKDLGRQFGKRNTSKE